MNASRSTSAHRRAELRADTQARTQQQRQRPLPTWLAARPRRRTLAVVVPALTLAVGVFAALIAEIPSWVPMILVPALGVAGVLALRRITQMLDAPPTALLDEREVPQRDRGYRDAFHLTAVLVFGLWALAVIDGDAADSANGSLLVARGWTYLTLTSFFTVLTLPAAALTWRWQPSTDDQDE